MHRQPSADEAAAPVGMSAVLITESSWSPRPDWTPEPFLSQPAPRLPRHDRISTQGLFGSVSLFFHAVALTSLLVLASASPPPTPSPSNHQSVNNLRPRFVFLATPGPGGGGGGGGNRQRAPVARAQAPGRDAMTLPVAAPIIPATHPSDATPPAQAVVLEAKPLASGLTFHAGLPDAGPMTGTSQGPGSGGGVGDGLGTGIGSGRGPGIGPGSGGGIGGGIYRPGGGVTPPTVLLEVKPAYSADAMRAKIQGSVLLEVVVQSDGTPGDIRIIRSLDREGLDRQAVLAVRQWRFNPGRLGGVPVDVLVTIVLDFWIH